MVQKKPIHLLNKSSWENVVEPFSGYRDNIEVTSLFRDFLYISLNESAVDRDNYTVFMGEKMFFKDYSENDLINIFARQDLIKTDVQRSVEDSETFGKEYMIEMIFRKKQLGAAAK